MSDTLIQRARDIAADQFIRLQVKNPTRLRPAIEWAKHVEDYAQFLRDGAYDDDIAVQAPLAALRSVA